MSRIMVVDDAVVIREKLKILLTRGGHEVVAEAGNGLQAALLYTRYRPDIVTMDITMPGVDGIDGIRKIRENDLGAQVVVISGLGQKALILEALEAGAAGFILKPFDTAKVLSVIATVQERARSGAASENADRLKAAFDALKNEKNKMDDKLSGMMKASEKEFCGGANGNDSDCR